MIHKKKMLVYLLTAVLVSFLALLIVLVIVTQVKKSSVVVTNFEECAATGAPILESFPEQCMYGGKTYTRELTQEEIDNLNPNSYPAEEDYYGSSSESACSVDSDCVIMGCNSEICGGVSDEDKASICIDPYKPTPKELGYSCSCAQQMCRWKK